MSELPRGTVAFLFTDIEGSTGLWERFPHQMPGVYARHDELLRAEISAHGGVVYKVVGDALQAAFPDVPRAVTAALAAQQALAAEPWPAPVALRVRAALHAGTVDPDPDGDYRAPALNRLGRLLAAAHGEQILCSLAAAELARDHLPSGSELRDLGEHRLRDLYRPERVFQLVHPGLRDDFPPLRTLATTPNNLPAQPTPLIGRARELAQTAALLLQTDIRLVTLTGPGGIGKTRLGLQLAADLLDEFPGGVWLIELAPITDPGLVLPTIAAVLSVWAEGDGSMVEAVAARLAGEPTLLVLDNLEQVIEAAAEIGRLLAAAPTLTVIGTSRAPLRLRGERAFPVPTLPLPNTEVRIDGPDRLGQYEAVRLFVERAMAVRPGFAVTNENAPAVAAICQTLDGLPLAIELAAARLRLLTPDTLLARLERRLGILTGGARDLPARQQTMRNAIAWSHDLLPPDQRTIFRRLAVFAGGFTLEAAEAVATEDDGLDVFAGIDALTEQSLVRRQDNDDSVPRFALLETVREYAQEQLVLAGEGDAVRGRHAAFFVALAGAADAGLYGQEQQSWFDRLGHEIDNLRAAMSWDIASGDGTATLRIASGSWRFFRYKMRGPQIIGWFERAFALPLTTSDSVLAMAYAHYGQSLLHLGHLERGTAVLETALRLAQAPGDERWSALALSGLTWAAIYRVDLDLALQLGEQAREAALRAGHPHTLTEALSALAVAHSERGEDAVATELMEHCIDIDRRNSDAVGLCVDSYLHGHSAVLRGDPTAEALLREAHKLAVMLDLGNYVEATSDSLGRLAIRQGDFGEARRRYLEIMNAADNDHDLFMMGNAVFGFALAAPTAAIATRFLAIFETINDEMGSAVAPSDRPEYNATVAASRADLGDAGYANAYAAARALTLSEAVAEALALARGAIDR